MNILAGFIVFGVILIGLLSLGIYVLSRTDNISDNKKIKTKEGEKKFNPVKEGKKLILPLIIFFVIFYIYEYITKGYISDAVFEAVFATLGLGIVAIITRPIFKWLGEKYNKNGRLYWLLAILFGFGVGVAILRAVVIASWRVFSTFVGS